MHEVIIVDEPVVRVTYHQELSLIKVVWNGIPTREQYVKAFTSALDFQEKSPQPITRFISDVRRQGIVNPENRKWFEQVVIPRAVKQGFKYAAVIFDGNAFKKYYLNLILQTTNIYKVPFKFFSTEEEAIAWFKTLKM